MQRSTTVVSISLAALALTVGAARHVSADQAVDSSSKRVSIAVIGDVPYGMAQEATVGELIGAVNTDPKIRGVVHVGDIKNGSTTCTDERFRAVYDAFETFEDPLIYTPGDNEWTDCHRVNNGSYDPLERLAALRELFFAEPGATLGRRPGRVDYQPELVEDVRWVESQTVFATLHVVGSDNSRAPWSGLGLSAATPEQLAEVAARTEATLDWIDAAFDAAEAGRLPGVVLFMQADTYSFSPVPAGLQPINDRIAERTAEFDGEVLVIQGDSHAYVEDHPVPVDNLTRIVVHGETLPFEYLRLTVDPQAAELFGWERVQVPG